MPSRFERYRAKDGLTKLGEAYFNPVFGDIDLRLATLEQVKISWENAVATLTEFGLARINDALLPTFNEINAQTESVLEKAAEIEAKRLAAIAALQTMQATIDQLESTADADISAWVDTKQAEFDAWLNTLQTGGYLQNTDIGSLVQAYDADLTAWAGIAAPTGAVVGTTDPQTLTNKTITGARETVVGLTGNDIDLLAGNRFVKTISGNTVLTVSNLPNLGATASFTLDVINGGSANVTWWSGVKWAGGTAPSLTASGRDVLGFIYDGGGTTWTGLVLGKDVK